MTTEEDLITHYDKNLKYKSPANNEKIIKKRLGTYIQKGSKLLDLGCGTGLFCSVMTEWASCVTHGVDYSPKRIEKAKETYPNLQFTEASIYDFLTQSTELYDVITAWEVIEHLERPRYALELAMSCLKYGGYIVGSVPLNMPYTAHLQVFKSKADIEQRLDVKVIDSIRNKWVIFVKS